MAKKQSINKKIAKQAIKDLTTAYTSLVDHYDKYVGDLVAMNEQAWSGGKRANATYEKTVAHYANSVKVVTGLKNTIEALDKYVEYVDGISNITF